MFDDDGHIKYDSDIYKEFYNITKYFYGLYLLNKTAENNENITPFLMELWGNDERMGVTQYKLLKILSGIYSNLH